MPQHKFHKNTACRICAGKDLTLFLSLGKMPLANGFLRKEGLAKPEPVYPMDIYRCNTCGLVQLMDIPPEEEMFGDYAYFSSTSQTMQDHFKQLASHLTAEFLPKGGLAVDIGCNDGILLRQFPPGIRLLGIEPARNLAAAARKDGFEIVNQFWTAALGKQLAAQYGKASAITCTNAFCHIDDLHDFMAGVSAFLADDGVFVHEDPYLLEVIKNNEFDQFYHEHMSYFSIRSQQALFRRCGMEIVDVERTPVHGGSIRISVMNAGARKESLKVRQLLEEEQRAGLQDVRTYTQFSTNLGKIRQDLTTLLQQLKQQHKTVVGYGASSKGNVWLNYCKIGPDLLRYISDNTPAKQGLFTPGTHVPVVTPEQFHRDRPDYALLLAWNFKDEILRNEHAYRAAGGKFILPVPSVTVV